MPSSPHTYIRELLHLAPKHGRRKDLGRVSNFVRPFDYLVKAGQLARQKVFPG